MNMPYTLSESEKAALLRHDLSSFIFQCFIELNPTKPYSHNWHIDLIASRLLDVLEGKTTRLIINVPPRSLKSVMVSVAFVAWALGHHPSLRLICASYGQDLADDLAQFCRRIMQSEWYLRLFGVTLVGGRPPLADFRTTASGGRFATSVGGVLTGRGGDIIIIDDPLKAVDALSDTERQSVNDWFDHTVMTRLNDKKTGAIVIIMQRLHQDDLVGHVLEHGDWDVLSLPAIAEVEERFVFNTVFGEQEITRKVGDLLHPAWEPLEVLENMRATLGEYSFAGQYQQSPVPLGGGLVKTKWLIYLDPHEFPEDYDSILQSWDTASKTNQLADFSVCTTWGIKDGKFYLLDVWRKRADFPELKQAVIAQYLKHKPQTILVEDKSSGTALIQELKEANIYCIKSVIPKGDKEMRLFNKTTLFENGAVNLPAKASWLAEYVHELTSFPTAKYDDQVDSTTQALEYFGNDFPGSGLFKYYQMEYEKLQNKNRPPDI